MWICLNNAFFSVVKDSSNGELLIRARVGDHILVAARHLKDGESRIVHTPYSDYQFRIVISKGELSELLRQQVDAIEYTNFKDSVGDEALSTMYNRVWGLGVQFLDPQMPYRSWTGVK